MAALALLLLALLGGAFLLFKPGAPSEPSVTRPQTAVVRRQDGLVRSLPLSGSLLFIEEGVVTAPENGTITSVNARVGDRISAGATFCTIDCRELIEERDSLGQEIQAEKAALELRESEGALERNSLERKRTSASAAARLAAGKLAAAESFYQQGFASQVELEKTRVEAADADAAIQAVEDVIDLQARKTAVETGAMRSRMAAARARHDRLEERIGACDARSPRAVLVTAVNEAALRKGMYVQRFQQLLEYSVPGRAEAVFAVPTAAAAQIESGRILTVTIGTRAMRGAVRAVGSASASTKETVPLYVRLNEDCADLVAGQRVESRVTLGQAFSGLVLPAGAYVGSGRLATVFMVKGDRAVKTAVRLSAEYDEWIVVLQGLAEGDEVIVSSYDGYLDYESVRIQGGTDAGTARGE